MGREGPRVSTKLDPINPDRLRKSVKGDHLAILPSSGEAFVRLCRQRASGQAKSPHKEWISISVVFGGW